MSYLPYILFLTPSSAHAHTHNFSVTLAHTIFHTYLCHTSSVTCNLATRNSSHTSFQLVDPPPPLCFYLTGRSWLVELSGPCISSWGCRFVVTIWANHQSLRCCDRPPELVHARLFAECSSCKSLQEDDDKTAQTERKNTAEAETATWIFDGWHYHVL